MSKKRATQELQPSVKLIIDPKTKQPTYWEIRPITRKQYFDFLHNEVQELLNQAKFYYN